jgi:hypothetical protein
MAQGRLFHELPTCSQGVTLHKKALEREREREKHMTNNKRRSACAIEEQSV